MVFSVVILLVGTIVMPVIHQQMPIQLLRLLPIRLQLEIYQPIPFRTFTIIWMCQMPMAVKPRSMVACQDLQVQIDRRR